MVTYSVGLDPVRLAPELRVARILPRRPADCARVPSGEQRYFDRMLRERARGQHVEGATQYGNCRAR